MYLQLWFYLDICKTKIFLSSSPHCDGNSYADKLKNPHMQKKSAEAEKSACWKPALSALCMVFKFYQDGYSLEYVSFYQRL